MFAGSDKSNHRQVESCCYLRLVVLACNLLAQDQTVLNAIIVSLEIHNSSLFSSLPLPPPPPSSFAAAAAAAVPIVGDLFAPVSASHDATCRVTCAAASASSGSAASSTADDGNNGDLDGNRGWERCFGACPGYERQGSVSEVSLVTCHV